ncbi:MAG: hypothetical protein H0X01_02665 [Nitrospira sp.]|nr:hypothetical protein [Nitrospira sp.]
MKKGIREIIEEIRQSKSVQDGLIIQNRVLREKLQEAQDALTEAEADTGAVDEAIELLDAMEEEGNAALAENTDGSFEPSGN